MPWTTERLNVSPAVPAPGRLFWLGCLTATSNASARPQGSWPPTWDFPRATSCGWACTSARDPTTSKPTFRRTAGDFGIDPFRLAEVVRYADTTDTMDASTADVAAPPPAAAAPGYLTAARRRGGRDAEGGGA